MICMYVWSSHIAEYGSTAKKAAAARAGVERQNGVTEDSRVLGERPNNINIIPVLKNVVLVV